LEESTVPNNARQKGFTLIEVIVASLILCGAVMAIGAISVRSLTGTKLNRQYEGALAVAEKQLCVIDYLGIDDFLKTGVSEGVVQEFEQEYGWRIDTEYQDIDNLYSVTVSVSWLEGPRPHTVTIQTRLNGTGKYVEVEEEEEDQTTTQSGMQ
jgi:prepilin-type N-terminal cleavage/methylation domain-containing protein